MARCGCLLVALLWASVAADTVHLWARDWPPAHCNLSTGQVVHDSAVDFWMRGAFSHQLYRCHLDAEDDFRQKVFSPPPVTFAFVPGWWYGKLARYFVATRPETAATRTPTFICASDGSTNLPGSLFPLRARRNTEDPWQSCFPAPDNHYVSRFTTTDTVVTLKFRGGAPTISCAVGRPSEDSLDLRGILGHPFQCYFATYLDFPAIDDPPAHTVFQKLVLDLWTDGYSPDRNNSFPPFQCWSDTDDVQRPFDFEVVFDGKDCQRCVFDTDTELSTAGSFTAETYEFGTIE